MISKPLPHCPVGIFLGSMSSYYLSNHVAMSYSLTTSLLNSPHFVKVVVGDVRIVTLGSILMADELPWDFGDAGSLLTQQDFFIWYSPHPLSWTWILGSKDGVLEVDALVKVEGSM